jgi:class 3 adenylate cyclase
MSELAVDEPEAAQAVWDQVSSTVHQAASSAGVYEVKRVGDALMFAAKSADRAANFAMACQTRIPRMQLNRIRLARSESEQNDLKNRSRQSTMSDTRSHQSHRSSQRQSPRGTAAARVSIGIGIHYALTHITNDSNRDLYDYSGVAVEGAAVCADNAETGQVIITEDVRDAMDMREGVNVVPRGPCQLRGGRRRYLFFLYSDKMSTPNYIDRRSDVTLNDDLAVTMGNVLAAIDHAAGKLARKKIAVLSLRIRGLEQAASKEDHDTFLRVFESVHHLVYDLTSQFKGVVHSAESGVYLIAFNAAKNCLDPFKQACQCAGAIQAELPGRFRASAGVTVGLAYCGTVRSDDSDYMPVNSVIVGGIVDQAVALSGIAIMHPEALFLANANRMFELESLALTAFMDITLLPHTSTRVGIVGALGMTRADSPEASTDEWMYVLKAGGGSAFAPINAAFAALLDGNLEAARTAIDAHHATGGAPTGAGTLVPRILQTFSTLLSKAERTSHQAAYTDLGKYYATLYDSGEHSATLGLVNESPKADPVILPGQVE